VTYAVSTRTLQPYVVRSVNRISSFDPVSQYATEATQVTEIAADQATGRALSGKSRTESLSTGTFEDGTPHGLTTIRSVAEETLQGLEKANALAMVSRTTMATTLNSVDHLMNERHEQLTQRVNAVGKILGAQAVTRTVTRNELSDYLDSVNLSETDYQVISGNQIVPTRTRSLEVTANAIDGSYRMVAREDATRYDHFGRIREIKEDNPSESGYELLFYKDLTVFPTPEKRDRVSPEALFEQVFGESFGAPSG